MFVRSTAKNKGIQTIELNIGEFFGEKPEEVQIVLAEASIAQSMQLTNKAEGSRIIENFQALMPEILVSHNLHETETELMSTEEVTKLIFNKAKLATHVLTEYTKALFPVPPKQSEGK